jgi:hypothetical protein
MQDMPEKLTTDRCRALNLLANSPRGCTAALMEANGFPTALLVDLVQAGLATMKTERALTDGRAVAVTRVRITDAGRRALAEWQG